MTANKTKNMQWQQTKGDTNTLFRFHSQAVHWFNGSVVIRSPSNIHVEPHVFFSLSLPLSPSLSLSLSLSLFLFTLPFLSRLTKKCSPKQMNLHIFQDTITSSGFNHRNCVCRRDCVHMSIAFPMKWNTLYGETVVTSSAAALNKTQVHIRQIRGNVALNSLFCVEIEFNKKKLNFTKYDWWLANQI